MQGQTDVPLNQNGKQQAALVGSHFAQLLTKDVQFDALYSSDSIRAFETAENISTNINLPIQSDQRLREMHLGTLQTCYYPDHTDTIVKHVKEPTLPYEDGESYAEVQQRVVEAIKDICLQNPNAKRIVIASHGVSIRCYLCHILQISLTKVYSLSIFNTSVSVVKPFYISSHTGELMPMVIKINSYDHTL
eukprot:TRINITY_DN10808_c0_g1_i1.p1 TRINITY_DN10808_c0_g1~~TRINITY_DN10808_c0_g1_i1.p1  ORF type:complete len:218 (+),score=33.22 TRINITY_DN10808_c0_g1_i1:83-655(+)